MKYIFLLISVVISLTSGGCIVSEGRGYHHRHHSEVIIGPPPIVVRPPEVIVP